VLVLLSPPATKLEEETLWLGTLESNLSDDGRVQAEVFARSNRTHYDRAYIGPGSHLDEFAQIVLPITPTRITEFASRSMGTLTGRPYRETMQEFPRRNWLAWQRSYFIAPPDGESFFDISERVLTAFRTKILPIEESTNVIIIAAPDVLRILIGHLSNYDETSIPKVVIESVIPYLIHHDFR
jgi:2,3-bisphosphoglycerate-dependent phosphoglycerate mutase